jgi:hypothetical protein
MKNFRVQIKAYGYRTDFNMESEDDPQKFEDALVDKLGKNDIVWEKDGFSDHRKLWITYEEVINANAHQRSLQTEEGSGDRVGGTAA